jgi:hypothetical protein
MKFETLMHAKMSGAYAEGLSIYTISIDNSKITQPAHFVQCRTVDAMLYGAL